MEDNLLIVGPIVIPFLAMVLTLWLANYNLLQRYIAVVSSLLSLLCSGLLLYQNWDTGLPQIYRLGGYTPPYGIVLVADMLSALFGVMSSAVLVGGFIYTLHCKEKSMYYPAFIPLFLCMSISMAGAMYTGDIFTLFVFIELLVVSSVVLVAVSDNPLGLEAAMKYLVISGMGTLFLLIGIGTVYASVSTLNMADISVKFQQEDGEFLARAAAVMLTVAFLLKSAVFPFHFWQPDFHTTAPTPVGAMLSSIVVKVGVYGILRMVTLLFVGDTAQNIEAILIVLGIIGIFFGSLGALRTYNAKRMLAYSTFGQIGFILVAIGWGTPLALMGAIIYAFNHAFIKSSLLMLTGVVSSHTQNKEGTLAKLIGAGKPLHFTGMLYFLGGLSLAGIPPMNGFISKLAVVRGGISAEDWTALFLVVGAGLLTLLYMSRAYVLMFQRNATDETAALKKPGEGDSVLAPALLIGICVLLGIYAAPLFEVVRMTVDQIMQPGIYSTAVLGS